MTKVISAIKDIYRSSPSFIQESCRYLLGMVPVPIRFGTAFRRTYALLQKSQYWSRELLERHQLIQLRKLLQHAYENVPYYRQLFKRCNLRPEDIRSLSDLRSLPYLTKDIIRNNLNGLIAKNIPAWRLRMAMTGGTTGAPLAFYVEKEIFGTVEWAFITSMWRRVGYNFGDKSAVLRGNLPRKGIYEFDPVNHQLILSSYHLTDKNMRLYVKIIRKFKPKFIKAYPSTITILAKFMEQNDMEPFPTVKALLLGSENIYDFQRKLLERVFNCRVFSWYGHGERAVLAGECEYRTYYHVFPEYGVTELIGKDGEPVTEKDDVGEIVATGFINRAMPFIRYRTRDLGVFTDEECVCGRKYPLLKRVEGRLQEVVVTKDGALIPLTALFFAQHLEMFRNIKNIQFIQEEASRIIVRIVKGERYSEKDEREFLQRIRKVTSNRLDPSFEYVEEIPRTKGGKHQYLIQKLPVNWEFMG